MLDVKNYFACINLIFVAAAITVVEPAESAWRRAAPTTTTPAAAPNATTTPSVRQVCYEGIGCFNNSAPFNNDGDTLPMAPANVGTSFRLYTRRNSLREDFEMLSYDANSTTSSSNFSSSLQTRVVIHGYMNAWSDEWMHNIKNAFLQIEDSNVVLVGWGPGAGGVYDQAVANTRLVARQLRLLLDRLVLHAGLQLSKVHLIGHSLGAHTSGDTGRQLGGQIGRITGMDPAGPDFLNYNKAVLLDKSDAQFVDVIHTNGKPLIQGGAGLSTPTAHVDFYVNGGRTQPGCKDGLSGLFSGGLLGASCSHGRSHQVFLESITTECAFTAYPCANQTDFQLGRCLDCEPSGCSELGLYADQHSARGSLFLNTHPTSPFCGFHYSVTVHAGQGSATTGTIYITLHGTWGETDEMQVTEEDVPLASGEDHVGVVVSPTEVGNVQSVNIRYNKYAGHLGWSWLGGGRNNFPVDAIDVLSGESGRIFTFCLQTRALAHSQRQTLQVSKTGTC